jgi:NAD(P)-dependent dehydrogenase (short-subunit alcohol dehydrogenase family)
MEIKNLFDLKGKTALITGGSQGIGKAISLALAEYGADIVINYRSNKMLALQTQQEIVEKGAKCWLIECDLSRFESSAIIGNFLRNNNLSPDILVLNASVQYRKEWYEVTKEEFEDQINTNFRSSLFLIQEIFPYMKEKGWGRIVTLGSVQQARPNPQMIVYAASKMAQLSMVKNLAAQIGKYGVTINNLSPGVFPTIRNEEVLKNNEFKTNIEKKIPLGYIGETYDCGGTALLLCSDAGKYITGQDIFVDGGMSLNF